MFIPSGMMPPATFKFAAVRPSAIWTAGLPDTCMSSLEWAPPQAPISLGLPLIFRSPLVTIALGGRPGSFLNHASTSLTELLGAVPADTTLIQLEFAGQASRV